MTRARLVFPALRARNGVFTHERAKIKAALAAGVGGFILFGGTRRAVTDLTRALRHEANRGLLFGSDLERGPGQQFRGLTELPPPAALGFVDDLDATYAAGMITATEALAAGVCWAFAPVCDLDLEARNPIVQTRSFGPDAERVGAHAAKWIAGCQEHGVMACAKHFPGHGRATTDSHEGLPVVTAPGIELRLTDAVPFGAAVQAGVGSVMSAFVAYTGWDDSNVAAAFSKPILGYLRDPLGFKGLIVTDAFIMGGATAAESEGPASVAAVSAGCDALLYPTDWQAVIRALDAVPAERAEEAMARVEAAGRQWCRSDVGEVNPQVYIDHQRFADTLADRAVHLLRGETPSVGRQVSVSIVDDDVGGPYSIPSRDVFAKALGVTPGRRPGVSRVILVYSEPRSWKGRGDLGERSLAQLERLAPGAALVVLFGHPRLAAQIPGEAPILCAWHGQALMQRAAARWVRGLK
jgi:beta-glucosidase-like glycosyl hydrolase